MAHWSDRSFAEWKGSQSYKLAYLDKQIEKLRRDVENNGCTLTIISFLALFAYISILVFHGEEILAMLRNLP